jgi:hypothetical protein
MPERQIPVEKTYNLPGLFNGDAWSLTNLYNTSSPGVGNVGYIHKSHRSIKNIF